MRISIVIPTYNRPDQLSDVLAHVLASEIEGFEDVEIIVVDDGSKKPAREIVDDFSPAEPFRLKYIYQENAGPASARNRGFREAENEIVLFIDDDILVFPDLIPRHTEAHTVHPGSVVYGLCPYPRPESLTPSFRYLERLIDSDLQETGQSERVYIRMNTIASGNISFERKCFDMDAELYGRPLTVPSGEEFDLAVRLIRRSIPIYFCPDIKGWHLQPTGIRDKCEQEYKYGLGIAEAAIKTPGVLEIPQVKGMFELNQEPLQSDPLKVRLKKRVRAMLANNFVRGLLLNTINIMERVIPFDAVLFPLYRLIIGTSFFAGVRDGIERFRPAR